MSELTPTGKLRVAIAVAPAPSAQFAVKDDSGGYRGVAVELGAAFAKKLGVPVDEERKKFVAFGNAYHVLESTYLVAPGSDVAKVADANRAGFRIGGIGGTATFRASNRTARHATHITFEAADQAVAALREGKVDAIAFSRETLTGLTGKVPGSRIVEDAFMNSTTSIAVPKGRPESVRIATEFIEEAKASGLVRKALDEMGLKSSQVAPAGMKS
jgi:polar amino acid transport system substrate-binding protein